MTGYFDWSFSAPMRITYIVKYAVRFLVDYLQK